MKYSEAIQALKDSEVANIGEIIAAINQEVRELQPYRERTANLETLLSSTLEGFGNSTDSLEAKLKDLSNKYQNATQALEAKNQEITSLNQKLAFTEKSNLINEAAINTKANREVLVKLLENSDLELKVANGNVTISEKPLIEYANENWTSFIPALFPQETASSNSKSGENTQTNSQNSTPNQTLPSGGINGKGNEISPIASILERYSLPEHLKAS